jgi:hypothetical protein
MDSPLLACGLVTTAYFKTGFEMAPIIVRFFVLYDIV